MIGELLKKHRYRIILSSLLSVVSALSGLLIMRLVSQEISQMESGGGIKHSFGYFLLAVFAVVFFGFLSGFLLQKLTESIAFELRTSMIKRFLMTSYERIEKIGGHRIFSTMTQDVGNITQGLSLLPRFIHSFVTVFLCLGYLFITSWKLSLIVFGMLAFALVIAGLLISRGMKYQNALRDNHDSLYKTIKSLVDGRKELGCSPKRKFFFFENVVQPVCKDMKKNVIRTAFIYTLINNWTTAQIFLVIGVVVYGSQLITGVGQMVVVSFAIVILYMIEPLIQLVDMLEDSAKYRVSYSRIKRLDLVDIVDFENLARPIQPLDWNTLNVRDLEYKYDSDGGDQYSFHVGPISLSIKRGSLVFFTGGNGSGKTTVAKLLVGLYEKASGGVYLDDRKVGTDVDLAHFRSLYSTIFSDFYVFEHVLDKSGNLADDQKLAEKLHQLDLDGVVTSDNGRLSSIELSHGQRKRLALLMSHFENSEICVYDEWAADQDPNFREYFYTSILPDLKARGKTVLVITHDDRYFSVADQLIKFEMGHVVSDEISSKDIDLRIKNVKRVKELVA